MTEYSKNAQHNISTNSSKNQEVKVYSVTDISVILNISKASAYQLTQQGFFKVMRIGKMIRISKQSFDEWMEQAFEEWQGEAINEWSEEIEIE